MCDTFSSNAQLLESKNRSGTPHKPLRAATELAIMGNGVGGSGNNVIVDNSSKSI